MLVHDISVHTIAYSVILSYYVQYIYLVIHQSPSEKSNSSHTISGSSLARYMPQVEDHNKTISCTVKQEEEGRLVIVVIRLKRF